MRRLLQWARTRWSGRRRRRRGCESCGICCEIYGHALRAEPEDLARWMAEGRLDLVWMVGEGGVLWVDRATGEKLDDCPFLLRRGPEEALCRIHRTKPALCRAYPTRAHGYRCVRGRRFDPQGG
ncbi:MAG: hypothetical protein Kow0092_28190 [Deferrisomatales bacterium]